MPGGSLWKDRVASGQAPKKGESTKVHAMPKQKRAPNAAEQDPPPGYIAGIAKAEEANDQEKKRIEELAAKMTSGRGAGKLSKEELRLVAKIDGDPKAAERLLGRGGKKTVAKIKDAAKDPGKTVKGVVKGAAAATNERRKKGFWG